MVGEATFAKMQAYLGPCLLLNASTYKGVSKEVLIPLYAVAEVQQGTDIEGTPLICFVLVNGAKVAFMPTEDGSGIMGRLRTAFKGLEAFLIEHPDAIPNMQHNCSMYIDSDFPNTKEEIV
jgi:hypothetical protein